MLQTVMGSGVPIVDVSRRLTGKHARRKDSSGHAAFRCIAIAHLCRRQTVSWRRRSAGGFRTQHEAARVGASVNVT